MLFMVKFIIDLNFLGSWPIPKLFGGSGVLTPMSMMPTPTDL